MPKPSSSRLPAPEAEAQPTGRVVTVSFPVSEDLHTALKVRAAQERTTVRGMVMKGLKLVGLNVPEVDLLDRRPGRSGRKDRT